MAAQIEIVPFNQEWAGLFEQERQLLQDCLLPLDPVVEHIGSTSVKGLGAKPVIDILIGLPQEAQLAEVAGLLLEAGYCYFPCYEVELPERRFFARLPTLERAVFDNLDQLPAQEQHPHTHHLHVVAHGSPFWKRRLGFRDYLRSHPVARDAYFRMKVKLAKGSWESENDYAAAKTAFIHRIEWLMGL